MGIFAAASIVIHNVAKATEPYKIVLVEKGVTSRELARGLNKAESTVSLWCTNDKQPSVETFYQIAQFLDIDLRQLFVQTKP